MTTKTDGLPAREQVPVEKTWDLTLIFATEADWEAALAKVQSLVPTFVSTYKGRISRSGKLLLAGLKAKEEIDITLNKVMLYASSHNNSDTTNAHYQGLLARARRVASDYGAAASWFKTDLLRVKPARFQAWVQKLPELAVYSQGYADLQRKAKHVRSAEVESVLALASPTVGAAGSVFNAFNNADLKFPTIKGEDGKDVQITHGNFLSLLDSQNRDVREAAWKAYHETFIQYKNSLAAMYIAQVKQDVFQARVRNHASAIAMALGEINVPVAVYENLVNVTRQNLDKLHRYLNTRKKVLGVDKLQFWDLYVPIYDMKVTYEEACKMVIESTAILGKDYQDVVRRAFSERWVDVMENQGKVSGAYSSGVYGTVPYMLMNWQDTLGTTYTLAHENGHSMHSWLSRTTQPHATCYYTLFSAETASTVNEALFTHYLLKNAKTKEERKFILNEYLDRFRATLFRQTLFAEFEMIIHAKEEAGEPLTVKSISDVYLKLCQDYYGGAVEVPNDSQVAIEWARIPHFYRSFYVYQYATGITGATVLAGQILEEGAPALERYLNFLKSGGSDYTLELLKKAGADLSDPSTVQKALDVFGKYVEEFESLC